MTNRIPSLSYSTFHARAVLRTRFAAMPLLQRPHMGLAASEQDAPSDLDLLKLLLDTTSSRNDDEATAREEYERVRSKGEGELPDFDEALARGWFRSIQGRVAPAVALRDYYLRHDVPYSEALRSFVYWLSEVVYHIAQPGTYASAGGFETFLCDERASSTQKPPVLTPAWIAARLWEGTPSTGLAAWAMRWELLDWVELVPSIAWSQQDAERFRQAALQALRNANLPAWDHVSMPEGLRTSGDMRDMAPIAVRPDLLSRVLGRTPSHYGSDFYEAHALCALMRVLTLELAYMEAGPVPSKMAQELAAIAMGHPDLCDVLINCCLQAPQLLADFVFCPPTASLVCYLVATWQTQFQTDRDYRNEAADSVQASLLADCLEVLQHHLLQNEASAVEYARLLVVMQAHDGGGHEGIPLLPIGLHHLYGLPAEIKQQVRRSLVEMANTKASSPEFAAMLKAVAVIGEVLPAAEAQTVASTYQQAFRAKERADTRSLDTTAAGVLVRLAMDHDNLKPSIFYPLDEQARVRQASDDVVGLGLSMREQIRMLSRAIVGYHESVPDELVEALASAIQSGASNRRDKGRVDAFTFHLDGQTRGRPGPRLEVDLINAVNRLEVPSQQECIINSLLLVEDPLVPALLAPRVPMVFRDRIAARLKVLTPGEASKAIFVTQPSERGQALLDAGFPELASAYLREAEEALRDRDLPALAVQSLNQKLQIHYQSGAFDAIASAKIPDGLQPEHLAEAQRTLDFFRALVHLKNGPSQALNAAGIFQMLYERHPLPVYAINLLAARMLKLLGENLFRIVSGEDAAMARFAIDEADRAIPSVHALVDLSRAIHVPNCAAMLLAIGRPWEAMNRLKELAAVERTAESTAFEAVASARLGEPDRARALIRSGKERFGETPLLVGAESHIDHSAGFGAPPLVLSKQDQTIQLQAALRKFIELPASEQAEVLLGPHMALERLLTATFQDALAAFQRTLSFLKLDRHKDFNEDDFNGLVAELVEARFEGNLGWQAHEQSPGGYTKKGNAGRRDFVIRRRGVDITVFEALKAERPNDDRIAEHLHKLFSYSWADILFHVTYSNRKDGSEMRTAIEEVAKRPPSGTTYLGQSPICADGARPGAVRAAYRRNGVDTTVIFFVIDMRQEGLRRAVAAPEVSLPNNA
ncbi:hypothetical protein ACOTF3_07020 [Achromobacter xylosoxidans]